MTRQGSLADRGPARGCLDATHQRGASSSTPCGLVDFGESKHFRAWGSWSVPRFIHEDTRVREFTLQAGSEPPGCVSGPCLSTLKGKKGREDTRRQGQKGEPEGLGSTVF